MTARENVEQVVGKYEETTRRRGLCEDERVEFLAFKQVLRWMDDEETFRVTADAVGEGKFSAIIEDEETELDKRKVFDSYRRKLKAEGRMR